MKARVLGLMLVESKKGNEGTLLSLEIPFDDYRQGTTKYCSGMDCVQEYIRGDLSSQIKVGQEVTLIYGRGYEGKAVLREVIPANEK